VVFLVALFLIKNGFILKNTVNFIRGNSGNGLAYDGNITVKDLVNKDTDTDGIPDWEEILWGLDPNKKETTPGVPDGTTISKLKASQATGVEIAAEDQNIENLTQTDKFSRELFSTLVALSQNGTIDETTAEKISGSLAEQIQNSAQRKMFISSDLKILNDNSIKAIKNYKNTTDNIPKKYTTESNVLDILQRFIVDENTVDPSVLVELDPIIAQAQNMIDEILKMSVPQILASTHLNFLNAGQGLLENVSDIRLFDTDPIVAMGGIGKYEESLASFQSAFVILAETINKKLNN
jgi:hypothetical protein